MLHEYRDEGDSDRLGIQWLINCCGMAIVWLCHGYIISVVSVVAIWPQPPLSWDAEGVSEASSHPSHALFHEVLSEVLSKECSVHSPVINFPTPHTKRSEKQNLPAVSESTNISASTSWDGRCNFDQKRVSCKIHAGSLTSQKALPMTMSKVWDSPGHSRCNWRVWQCMKRKMRKKSLNCDYAHEISWASLVDRGGVCNICPGPTGRGPAN